MNPDRRVNHVLADAVYLGMMQDQALGAARAWACMAKFGVSNATIRRVLAPNQPHRSQNSSPFELDDEETIMARTILYNGYEINCCLLHIDPNKQNLSWDCAFSIRETNSSVESHFKIKRIADSGGRAKKLAIVYAMHMIDQRQLDRLQLGSAKNLDESSVIPSLIS